MVVQRLPSLRICQLLKGAFGLSVSEGTLYNIRNRCFDALEIPEQDINVALQGSKVVHFDETGFRVASQLWWLNVGCTDRLTFYFVHTKRGKKAMDAMGLLPDFKGNAVHDGWASYGQYACQHSLCNAHHLRKLIFIVEEYHQSWEQEMIDLLVEINGSVNLAKADQLVSLATSPVSAFEQNYGEILERGFKENPALRVPENAPKRKGRPKQGKAGIFG